MRETNPPDTRGVEVQTSPRDTPGPEARYTRGTDPYTSDPALSRGRTTETQEDDADGLSPYRVAYIENSRSSSTYEDEAQMKLAASHGKWGLPTTLWAPHQTRPNGHMS